MVQRVTETPAETIPGESKETSSDSSRSEALRVQQVNQTRRCTTSEESKVRADHRPSIDRSLQIKPRGFLASGDLQHAGSRTSLLLTRRPL